MSSSTPLLADRLDLGGLDREAALTEALLLLDGVGRIKQTQSSLAYPTIRAMIAKWRLPPGSMINEKELMDQTGFGRTPIREALLRLSAERLVVFSPSREIRVAPVDLTEVRDLYEVRLQTDRLAARLCLENMSEEQKNQIVGAFDGVEDLIERDDHVSVFYRDFRLHTLIYKASGNSMLRSIHTHMLGHFFRLAYFSFFNDGDPSKGDMRNLVTSHDAMIDAIKRKSVEDLDKVTADHTVTSYRYVVNLLAGDRMNSIRDLSVDPMPAI